MLSNHLILCCSLLLLPSVFATIRIFSQWAHPSHQVAKILELQLQHKFFQWIFRLDFLSGWLIWFPCSPRNSQESFLAPHFKNINSLALSLLYGPTLIWTCLLENYSLTTWTFVCKVMSLLFKTLSRFVITFFPRSNMNSMHFNGKYF